MFLITKHRLLFTPALTVLLQAAGEQRSMLLRTALTLPAQGLIL